MSLHEDRPYFYYQNVSEEIAEKQYAVCHTSHACTSFEASNWYSVLNDAVHSAHLAASSSLSLDYHIVAVLFQSASEMCIINF